MIHRPTESTCATCFGVQSDYLFVIWRTDPLRTGWGLLSPPRPMVVASAAVGRKKGDLMRRRIATLLTVIALLVAGAFPAWAIQFGNVDGDDHPYVGMVLFFDARASGWFRCSGSLVTPTVFITAGHCVFAVGLDGELTASLRDGNDAWVNMDTAISLAGFPPSDPANPYDPRADFLNGHGDWVRADKVSAHPAYADFAGFPNTSDIGVVILSEGITVSRYASLPDVGDANDLVVGAVALRDRPTIVGYGLQGVRPTVIASLTRHNGDPFVKELKSANSGGWNIHLSGNPGKGNGRGSACFGDSGGPVLAPGGDTILGVGSFVLNPSCTGASFYYRADTNHALDWIEVYAGL